MSLKTWEKKHRSLRRKYEPENCAQGGDPLFLSRIGSYIVLRKIGAGPMSTVHRAVPASTLEEAESVALKIITAHIDNWYRHCERNLPVLRTLDHPCIIKIYEYGELDESHFLYMAMEVLAGKTLNELVTEKGVPLAAFIEIFPPLVEAVDFGLGKGVGDLCLRPHNILVNDRLKIKIMDPVSALTRLHLVRSSCSDEQEIGPPYYIPPEGIEGTHFDDPRSHMYSLGVMAFELLTGKLPFAGDNAFDYILKSLTEKPREIKTFRADIPEDLEHMISTMIAKDRDLRFSDLTQVLSCLERIKERCI